MTLALAVIPSTVTLSLAVIPSEARDLLLSSSTLKKQIPHFVRDDSRFIRDDNRFIWDDSRFIWDDSRFIWDDSRFVARDDLLPCGVRLNNGQAA